MKKIYTGIDLGSYSIKIVVCEVIGNKFHVLAASNTRCKGIKNGVVADIETVKPYLLQAKQDVESMLGISINQAIVSVPQDDIKFDMVDSSVQVEDTDSKIISSDDITNLFREATVGKVEEARELITITPISFQIDDKEPVKDPKGLTGDVLNFKGIITTIPKNNFKTVLALMKECGIEVVDATYTSIGDYFEAKNPDFEKCVSAIVNIGYFKTDISIFNKGIMIKNDSLNVGSRLIDRDIATIYKVKRGQARKLKESFAVSNTRYSNASDLIEIVNQEGQLITINQLEISEIVESRLAEILKLAKKQINVLTNREISYIIITGGISELAGFDYVVENVFDRRCSTLNINTMGIRNNMYSSSIGMIKYFHNKLDLRGLSYSMIDDKEAEELVSTNEKISSGIIDKIFGYFSGE